MLEPSGGNSSFEPLLNPANTTTTWIDSCRIMVDALGTVTATIFRLEHGSDFARLIQCSQAERLKLLNKMLGIDELPDIDQLKNDF